MFCQIILFISIIHFSCLRLDLGWGSNAAQINSFQVVTFLSAPLCVCVWARERAAFDRLIQEVWCHWLIPRALIHYLVYHPLSMNWQMRQKENNAAWGSRNEKKHPHIPEKNEWWMSLKMIWDEKESCLKYSSLFFPPQIYLLVTRVAQQVVAVSLGYCLCMFSCVHVGFLLPASPKKHKSRWTGCANLP